MNFDFHPDHKNPSVFLQCIDSRAVRHEIIDGEVMWSIDAMDDDELREAIVEDILGISMWEIQTGQKITYHFEEMTRFLIWNHQYERVAEMLKSEAVTRFVEQIEGEYRIKNSQEIRQAAMDYCGVWYSDYRMGEDVVVFDNQHREAMKSTIDQHGGIEQLAVALSMDLVANSNQQSKIPN